MSFAPNSAFQHGSHQTKAVIAPNHHDAPAWHCAYETRLLSKNCELIGCGSSRNEWIEGDHTKAFFIAVIELLIAVPIGSQVELLCNLNYAVEELSRPGWQRRSNGYLKSDGKSLLEDHAALKRIDEITEAKNITLSARRPSGYEEMRQLKAAKDELRKHPKVSPFGMAS